VPKPKAQVLRETEETLNELEAIRGRVGILETQFAAVVEIYKMHAGGNDPLNDLIQTVAPRLIQSLDPPPRAPRAARTPRRRGRAGS